MSICPICSLPAEFTEGALRSGKGYDDRIFVGVRTATCSECASTWAINPPTAEQLGDFYNNSYKIARIGAKQRRAWPKWDPRAASLITLARMFTSFRAGQVFLDIGPGGGEALGLASRLLPNPRLACIEFSQAAIRFYRSVLPQIYAQNSLTKLLDRLTGKIQIVYASHSFEHFAIEDLRADLVRINNLLTATGVLVCEVPNVSARGFWKAKNHVPHLIFFSRTGLVRLVESCGFDVRLCVEALGKHGDGEDYYNAFRERALADGVSGHVLEQLSALNSGDWAPSHDRGVLKLVAKRSLARDR